MTLEELEAMVASASTPPVDTWHPERVGSMDMVIRRDGSWWHEGGQIKRHAMVRLFAGILRCEEDGRHCLVTPAEKLFITVEDAPFLAISMHVTTQATESQSSDVTMPDAPNRAVLGFETNVGDTIIADADHPLSVTVDNDGNPTPYIHVRHGLLARLQRSVYYELANHCEEHNGVLGVWSQGVFHNLGGAGEDMS